MSLNTQPSNAMIETLRGLFQRRVQDSIFAVLGDSDGPGARVDVPGTDGYVYVRLPGGRDANGFNNYSSPLMALSAGAAFPNTPGFGVRIAYNDDGELFIKSAHTQSLKQAGINTSVLNPLNQQSKWVYPWQLTYGLANAVATALTNSTLVMVKSFRHYVGDRFTVFETPLEADKIDLSSYIPSAGNHCYAAVWIDTYTNLPVVTTSIAQAITTPLDATDIQELVVRVASSRPADGIPLKAFYLANGQTTIKQSKNDVDLRQLLDNPKTWGFPSVVTTLERVWPNMTLVTGPYTTSGVGAITVEAGGQIIIVHKNNLDATTAPTINDDSGDGYSVQSAWFNKTTGTFYIASDVTVGAAVWNAVAGSGAMTSFTVAGDSGTPQTISNGDTLTISGGTGLSSVASATDTVTVNLDNTTVTPGSYTDASVTIDAQGRVTAASSGTAAVNPPFVDTNALVKGSVDATKLMRFEVDGFTTGTTRVMTPPNYDVTLSPGTTKGDLSVFNGTDNVRLAAAANGRLLLTESSTSTGLKYDYTEVEIDVTWGASSITNGKFVYQSEVSGLWFLASTTAIGRVKGIVTDQGTSLINGAGRVRILGQYAVGSFSYGPIYADSTPGSGTSTEPTPTLGTTGNPIIIAQMGYGEDGGVLVNGLMSIIYRTWVVMAASATISITHMINRPSFSRTINARNVTYDTTVAETYASSNQDSSSQLRGQSGAGSLNTVNAAGVTRGVLGDSGGTDFRLGQSFQVTAAGKLSQITVFADTTSGSPSGTINWSIQTNSGAIPSGVSLTSGTIAGGSWTASANNTITVTNGPFLDVSTTYWLVLEMSAMQSTNVSYSARYDTAGAYASGVLKWDTTTGASFPGTWLGGGGTNDMRCSITTSALVTTDLLAQGVSHSSDITITSAKLWIKQTGNPSGTLTLAIYSDSAGSPNAVIANGTATTVAATSVSSVYTYIEFLFPVIRPTLTASTQYHLVLSTSDSASNTAYIEWGSDNTSPSYANGQLKTSISSVWAATSPVSDGCFQLLAQNTMFQGAMPQILASAGANGGIGVSYGDSSGANTDTITRITNLTSTGKEIMIDIVIPVQ